MRNNLALTPMSAKLFCKIHSLHLCRTGLFCKMNVQVSEDSDIERPGKRRLRHRIKKPGKRRLRCRTLNDQMFLFSAVLILATKVLINSSVSCEISFSSTGFLNSVFHLFHSKFDVGVFAYLDVRCSMFIFFSSSWPKYKLALTVLKPCF